MGKNRSECEKFILTYIAKIAQDDDNVNIYKNYFANLSDKQFDDFIKDLESEKRYLTITIPNFGKSKLTIDNNLKVAKELGHNFFQKVWIESNDGTPTYLTPNPYLIVDVPVRRASQLLIKKISVPDHNKVVDSLTGQPTGESKGAKLSYPELQICAAMNLDNSMVELMKYRGGDIRGHAALNGMVSKYGQANLGALSQYASGVESTRTLKTFLSSAHLRSTL